MVDLGSLSLKLEPLLLVGREKHGTTVPFFLRVAIKERTHYGLFIPSASLPGQIIL
jgi:hypothetical protein